MPATIEQEPRTVEVTTPMAKELQKTTDAAVKAITGGGFDDPEFAASLQRAIDKDAGKEPEPEKKVEAEPEAKAKAEPEKKVEIPDDIPAELLGEKKVEKSDTSKEDAVKAEAERQKYLEEQIKGMTPKAAERFKKIESRAHEAEEKAKQIAATLESEKTAFQKQLQDQLAKIAAKTEPPAEVEAMKKRVAELEEVVSKTAITEDPRFKARYDGAIDAEIETAKKLVPSDKAEEFAEVLAMPVSKKRTQLLKELTEGMDDFERGGVLLSVRAIDGIASAKNVELAKFKENKVHVDAEQIRQKETEAARIQEIQKVAWTKGMAVVSSAETGLEVFRKAAGNDEWNAQVDQRIANVQRQLSNLEPEKIVEMAARAVASEDYRQRFLASRILVKKLSSELDELKKAEPEAGNDGGDAPNAPDTDDYVTASVKAATKAAGLR